MVSPRCPDCSSRGPRRSVWGRSASETREISNVLAVAIADLDTICTITCSWVTLTSLLAPSGTCATGGARPVLDRAKATVIPVTCCTTTGSDVYSSRTADQEGVACAGVVPRMLQPRNNAAPHPCRYWLVGVQDLCRTETLNPGAAGAYLRGSQYPSAFRAADQPHMFQIASILRAAAPKPPARTDFRTGKVGSVTFDSEAPA